MPLWFDFVRFGKFKIFSIHTFIHSSAQVVCINTKEK